MCSTGAASEMSGQYNAKIVLQIIVKNVNWNYGDSCFCLRVFGGWFPEATALESTDLLRPVAELRPKPFMLI